jgi:hypothetical protein
LSSVHVYGVQRPAEPVLPPVDPPELALEAPVEPPVDPPEVEAVLPPLEPPVLPPLAPLVLPPLVLPPLVLLPLDAPVLPPLEPPLEPLFQSEQVPLGVVGVQRLKASVVSGVHAVLAGQVTPACVQSTAQNAF